jgi:TRAP-type C4-dicarboxylate transport system permease small subunit
MIAAITMINNAQVAGRYVFHYSLPWSEQLSIVLFIFIVMLGGNLSIKKDDEIKIDLRFANRSKQKVLHIVRDIISLITLTVLFISSVLLVHHALMFPQVISSMQLNYYYVFMVMTLGFGLMIFDKILILAGRFVRLEKEGTV